MNENCDAIDIKTIVNMASRKGKEDINVTFQCAKTLISEVKFKVGLVKEVVSA
jgi:hypothetical protein